MSNLDALCIANEISKSERGQASQYPCLLCSKSLVTALVARRQVPQMSYGPALYTASSPVLGRTEAYPCLTRLGGAMSNRGRGMQSTFFFKWGGGTIKIHHQLVGEALADS